MGLSDVACIFSVDLFNQNRRAESGEITTFGEPILKGVVHTEPPLIFFGNKWDVPKFINFTIK
jgi:hypothetical protein